jgi:hypothetical protein
MDSLGKADKKSIRQIEMQENELSTDMDAVMSILSSKKGSYFNFKSLKSATGVPTSILKKWILMLEQEKKVRIVYRFSEIEFCWIGKEKPGREENKITHAHCGLTPEKCRQKNRELILDDIREERKLLVSLKKRKEDMIKRKSADNATITIIDMMLMKKKVELASLIEQAKKTASA